MISLPWAVTPSRTLHRLIAVWIVLVAFVWITAGSAIAQTAHFPGEARVGNGFVTSSWGIAADANGNIYVSNNNEVEEILAVNGSIPSSPTIIPLASFYSTLAFAVDSKGNVYVADTYSCAIREILAVNGSIPPSPTIQTLYQSCQVGPVGAIWPFGVAVDSSGNVYFSDYNNNAVDEILAVNGSIPSSPTVISLSNSFKSPMSLAVDGSGNVYVGDENNGAVKEILAVNGSIPSSPTVVTLGSGFSCPDGVAVDRNGNVYVADYCANSAEEIVAVNGIIPPSPTITTLPNGLSEISGVAVDGNGNVYIAGPTNSYVYRAWPWGGDFGSISVGATSPVETLTATFDTDGTLGSTAVLTQGAAGLDFVDAGTGTCAANTAYSAGQTCTINVTFTPKYSGARYGATVLKDTNGNIFATAYLQGTGVAAQINFSPGTQTSLGSGFYQPWGLAVDASGNVFVAETEQSKVEELLAVNGRVPASPAIKTLGSGFQAPSDVAVDGGGNLYVTDFAKNAVYELTASSGYATVISLGGAFANPTGVALDGSGNIYVADYTNNAVKRMPQGCVTSACVTTLGSGFDKPDFVAVDISGNVFVSDSNNFAVKEILAAGGYTSVKTLLSGIHFPTGLALDGNANLFVTNDATNTVLELSALSSYTTSTTVSGTFCSPRGAAVDGAGNLYVADTGDSQVLMEDFADPPSLSFATTNVDSISSDSPQTVTLENIGNADLALPIPSTGNNPSIASNFTLTSGGPSDCQVVASGAYFGATLGAHGFCYLPISFAPSASGVLFGSLVITDNNLNPSASGSASQTIQLAGRTQQVMPVITWPTPVPITYGTALNAAQLNATANVPGTFTYSPSAGTVLIAGSQTLTVTFTPTDTTGYTTATATVTLTVNKAPSVITWPTPAPITYGTVLSATQLNASANVFGTFVYNPAAGTLPPVGNNTLTVTFTPMDFPDYSTAGASVILTVNPAPGFTLSASPSSLNIAQNKSATSTISVTDLGGFTGKVTLAATGLPSNVSASFSTNPTTGKSVLTLKPSDKAPVGTTIVAVTGTSGSLTSQTTIQLTISAK